MKRAFPGSAGVSPASSFQKPSQHAGADASAPRFRLPRLIFAGLPLIFRAFDATAQTNGLPALAPPLPELPPPFWELHGSAVLVIAMVALVIAVVVAILALRPKRAAIVPPEVEARRALEELCSRAEDGAVLSRVSQILRRYFIAVFALPPGEYTTAEFCHAISANEKIGGDLSTNVSDFLRACDEQKFSAAPQASPSSAVPRALELIALAEARRSQLLQSAAKTPAKP